MCYPKRTDKPLYRSLVAQLEALGVPFLEAEAVQARPLAQQCDLAVDAIFGFSFKSDPRPPFNAILQVGG